MFHIKRLARYYGVAKKSHYEVLHLSKNCTDKEIKSAFVTLCKELHPDKNKSPNAQKIFLEVLEAYNVLGKPNSRAQYDRLIARPQPSKSYKVHRAYEAPNFRNQQKNHFYNEYTRHSWQREESRAKGSVDGVAKVPNVVIFIACVVITTVSTMYQMIVFRDLYVIHKRKELETSRQLTEELERVRTAGQDNTNDMQTQLILLDNIESDAHPSVATASLDEFLEEEQT